MRLQTHLPMTSPRLVEIVGTELKKMHTDYYIIYWIILETGITLKDIVDMKVNDISSDTISYKPSHSDEIRHEPLSENLKKEITLFIKGRDKNDNAFYGVRHDKMNQNSFQSALRVVSIRCGITPVLSIISLKKTFIYRRLLKTGSFESTYAYTNNKCPKQVCEYLGIADTDTVALKKFSSVTSSSIDDTKRKFLDAISKIKDTADSPDILSYSSAYTDSVIKFLSKVDSAIELLDFELSQITKSGTDGKNS